VAPGVLENVCTSVVSIIHLNIIIYQQKCDTGSQLQMTFDNVCIYQF